MSAMAATMPGPSCRTLVHATTPESMSAMRRTRLVLPCLAARVEDGPIITRSTAPLVVWFTANTVSGRPRTTTSYGKADAPTCPALLVEISHLLSAADPSAVWDAFRLTKPDAGDAGHGHGAHAKYALACEGQPEWCWLDKHCERLTADGDKYIRLIRVSTSNRADAGWLFYSRDASDGTEVSLAIAPPKGAPLRLELFEQKTLSRTSKANAGSTQLAVPPLLARAHCYPRLVSEAQPLRLTYSSPSASAVWANPRDVCRRSRTSSHLLKTAPRRSVKGRGSASAADGTKGAAAKASRRSRSGSSKGRKGSEAEAKYGGVDPTAAPAPLANDVLEELLLQPVPSPQTSIVGAVTSLLRTSLRASLQTLRRSAEDLCA